MRQLTLDITTDEPRTLSNFVIGKNQELLQFLERLITSDSAYLVAPDDRFIYIWGQHGAGKSHILQALKNSSNASLIHGPDNDIEAFNFSTDISGYLIDGCDRLSASNQIEAFNLFNQIR